MNGFHVESMTQDKGDIFLSAEISDPVPGKDTFYSYHDIFSVSLDGFQEDFCIRSDIALKNDTPFLVDDTEVH